MTSFSSSSSSSSSSSCSTLIGRRKNCHALYGRLGEDCVSEELEEKRCVSFSYCASEAMAYYGSKREKKGLCASWAEHFSVTLSAEDDVREHHEQARDTVNKDAKLRNKCRRVTMELSKCMSQVNYPGRSG